MKKFKNGMRPVHPGEILENDFCAPNNIYCAELAQACGLPAETVVEIYDERAPITPEVDKAFCEFFGTTEGFWLSLQQTYESRVKDLENSKS